MAMTCKHGPHLAGEGCMICAYESGLMLVDSITFHVEDVSLGKVDRERLEKIRERQSERRTASGETIAEVDFLLGVIAKLVARASRCQDASAVGRLVGCPSGGGGRS